MMSYVTQKDPTSLKAIYQNLFEKIIVRPVSQTPQIRLEFVYRHVAIPSHG